MYYQVSGCRGRIKIDNKLAWTMIRQIIESGQETLLKRSFKLSI